MHDSSHGSARMQEELSGGFCYGEKEMGFLSMIRFKVELRGSGK